ncbi:Potassium transporter [Recurvomyces mirabilis]|uniref:Potassium transporter n=1 Tax=Recurvomyces mirabilis TaxID=574656 RepID=A0AAE1C0K4_9PEZI|nr:Potassium transporter [Recurvomyces mirabilis]KAK5152047.1 Potassium transporter [Recurvomyces mirabilis]
MGCGGDREKGPPEHTQKWDFITLSDFRATSIWTTLAYMWLWTMALVAVAVYAVDTFTAVNLLVFDKWSSQVDPAVPFKYSKWIFAACILLSWILCFYEWIRAIRVIKRGGVAESYMDTLAVTLQSMRGSGWGRFLVFTELTKSKKGADYVAFFVYFAFNGAVRVILAEGPRQAVNAMSLYAVFNADLLHGDVAGQHSNIEKFFLKLQALAQHDERQAIILSSMLFTLVIWMFSALSLLTALVLYLVFLWHYIPQRDGRLSVYCRRKIDRRLEKIVDHTVKAAIEEEEHKRRKAENKAELKRQKTGESASTTSLASKPKLARQPTLPQLGESPELSKDDNKLPEFALARQNTSSTVSTLPRYESRPPTRNGSQQQPTLPTLEEDRPQMPSRIPTQDSTWSHQSYESDAPLLSNAGYAGGNGRNSPAPSMPPAAFSRQGSNASFGRPMPGRTMTNGSQSSQRPFSPMSNTGPMNRPPPGARFPVRTNTGFSSNDARSVSPMTPQDGYGRPMGPPMRQNTHDSFRTAPLDRQASQASSFGPPSHRRPSYNALGSQQGSFSRLMQRQPSPPNSQAGRSYSPAPGQQDPYSQSNSYEMTSQPSHSTPYTATAGPSPGGYRAFTPAPSTDTTSPIDPAQPQLLQPKRNLTVAGGPGAAGNYFGDVRVVQQRSATAPLDPRHTTGYGDIIDNYNPADNLSPPTSAASSDFPFRATTSGPGQGLSSHPPFQHSAAFAQRHPASSIYSSYRDSDLQRPSLPDAPMPGLTRAQTASPMGMHPSGGHGGGVTSSIYSADDRPRIESQTIPGPPLVRAQTAGIGEGHGQASFGRVADMRSQEGRTSRWEMGSGNRF